MSTATTITTVKTESNDELFCQYKGQSQPQPVYLTLDIETGELACSYWTEIGGGYTAREHNRLSLRWKIPPLKMRGVAFLMENVKEDCQSILNNSEVIYDGSNYVGKLNEEAEDLCYILESKIDRLFKDNDPADVYMVWEPCYWFEGADLIEEYDLTSETSVEDLQKLADLLEEEASHEGVFVDGVYDYLQEIVDAFEEDDEE